MLELFLTVAFLYIIYYISNIKKFNKDGTLKLKKGQKVKDIKEESYRALPVEAKYFIRKYNINMDKINNKGLLKLVAYTLGLNIALITILVGVFIENIIAQIAIGSIILIPLYLLSLHLLSKNLRKRGLINNERITKLKKDRK